MATKQIDTIELTADSNKLFFLVHGYTGSPTDFHRLPALLQKELNANVKVMLLPGHGTQVEDLDTVSYEDLMQSLRNELEFDLATGKEVILGGVSMGGLFALQLAAEYPVAGVINVSTPYYLRFPFRLPGLRFVLKFKKYWKKPAYTFIEQSLRTGSFSYGYMHGNGLKIVKEARKNLKRDLQKITCPVQTIYSTKDKIGHLDSVRNIQDSVHSEIKDEKVFYIKPHNIFYSTDSSRVNGEIIRFAKRIQVLHEQDMKPKKVAAIIPAYNEGPRIAAVLKVVTAVANIHEVIVVDDGSKDDTQTIVQRFPSVRYMRNDTNIGKAGSMDRGVASTDADVIFFCDADLIDVTPEIIEKIIEPVLERKFSMFIGLRKNLMQNSVHLFAINSGERAVTRKVWEELPQYFKCRYRVEAGLNYSVRKYFGGFGYQTFNYSQPLKEQKYGLLKGTYLRWSMNFDVLLAYGREFIEHLFNYD